MYHHCDGKFTAFSSHQPCLYDRIGASSTLPGIRLLLLTLLCPSFSNSPLQPRYEITRSRQTPKTYRLHERFTSSPEVRANYVCQMQHTEHLIGTDNSLMSLIKPFFKCSGGYIRMTRLDSCIFSLLHIKSHFRRLKLHARPLD